MKIKVLESIKQLIAKKKKKNNKKGKKKRKKEIKDLVYMYIMSTTLTFHERKIIFVINCIINQNPNHSLTRKFRETGVLAKVFSPFLWLKSSHHCCQFFWVNLGLNSVISSPWVRSCTVPCWCLIAELGSGQCSYTVVPCSSCYKPE